MDYVGWELKRQGRALAALLPGGGEDGKTVWDRERRSPAEPGAALRSAAGQAGRYAGGGYGGDPADGGGALDAPVSAWENILDGGEAGGALEGKDRREAGAPLSEGTGARAESSWSFSGYGARTENQETAAEAGGPGEEGAGEHPAGNGPGSGEAAGATFPGMSPGGKGDAVRRIKWTPVARRTAPVPLDGGDPAGTPGREGSQEWTRFSGGGWGSAALQPEDSARALSRAVQRDARRYDGGFEMY